MNTSRPHQKIHVGGNNRDRKTGTAKEKCIQGGMLALSDLRTGILRGWSTAAVLSLLYTGYWAVMLLTDNTALPEDRLPVLYLTALFFSFSVPATTYGYINDSSDGVGYTMLPIPVWVKFGVMMVVSVLIIPMCYYLGIHIIDCVLALASRDCGFQGMIWESGGMDFCSFWSDFCKICLYQSIFVLGNIILHKHKITLTVLLMLAMHGLAMGIFQIDEIRSGILYILYSFVAPLCIWAAAYFMFKRLQFS